MMRKLLLTAGLTAWVLAATPANTFAQASVTPFAGAVFSGDAPDATPTGGVALTYMGRFAGFEAELGYTPDFFNEEDDDVVLVGDSNAMSLMGNLLLGYGEGPVKPYATVGAGLLRMRVDGGDLFEDVSSNSFGVNVGGGVIGHISEHIALRGDIRYFRSLEDEDPDDDLDLEVGSFDFWRAYAGVTFSF
jgi:opacity protein-like surface antigen